MLHMLSLRYGTLSPGRRGSEGHRTMKDSLPNTLLLSLAILIIGWIICIWIVIFTMASVGWFVRNTPSWWR